ncbi:kinesin family protein [Cordyceps militaris CM01]|uniref:Kinesin-like protein n=1 Tax=Cordyceps militaris (strain CM01) TaxID=983644 RepID=G3J5E3_CORMM|nr:kinesin family protein [Cordyceps militaris CM01]EGX96004.1 kinesin family protein [Cordyceps militaris CM01]
MDVFVRWRPLVGAETVSGSVTHTSRADPSSARLAITIDRGLAPSDKPWTSASAFTRVLSGDTSNAAAYTAVAQPAVPRVLAGGCHSVFAYGHSGSGKTHTVVGYQDESGPGLCLAAAEELFAHIATLNARGDEGHPELAIGLAVFELRQKAAFDLLNDGTKCHIREGPDGKVHIRGETETLADGKVRVRPIVKRPCWSLAELRDTLRDALARRAVGASSVHDQSSRTHAVLELEIVNAPLIAARAAVVDRQSELVPVGKRATDVAVAEQTKGVLRDADGTYRPNPGYVVNQALIDAVDAEKAACEARVAEAEAHVDAIRNGTDKAACLGGRMVFVDLAGAEYQQDGNNNMAGTAQTPAERQEARQINADLLALKEVMRAWAANKPRVPYRASPLTMVLRETLGDAARHGGGGAGMVVTVSPATVHRTATLNSLKYASLMGTVRGA